MRPMGIRERLAVWYSLILALSLCTFGGVAYFTMNASIRSTVDAALRARIEGLRTIIEEDSPKGRSALKDEIKEFADGLGTGGRVQVIEENGEVLFTSPGAVFPDVAGRLSRPFYEEEQGATFRVLRKDIEFSGSTYHVELGLSMEDYSRALHRFRRRLFLAVPVFLGIAILGGYWLSRRALAPVDEITETARSIGARDLAKRLVVSQTGDELARLAGTLNEMLARLEAAFQRITQFTADASHELRTPVAVVRAGAEVALRKPRTEAEYREALTQILTEAEKVSQLIEQLLTLARSDSGAAALALARTDLVEPLREACLQATVLAQAKQIEFREHIPASLVWIAGDPASLERLFLIVLDNAVKYTPEAGQIDVGLRTEEKSAIVEIRDTGIGIAAEDIAHVFDRFYRADRVRSRESGGTGLGLAIGRWIAEAHRGEIAVESEPGKGSLFVIRLPLIQG